MQNTHLKCTCKCYLHTAGLFFRHPRDDARMVANDALDDRAHGPLTRYVKLRVAHASEMLGTFSRYRGLAIHTCTTARAVMHAGIAD